MRRNRSRLATAATLVAAFAAWHFTGGLHDTALEVQLPPGNVTVTAAVTATTQCQPLPETASPAPSASPTPASAVAAVSSELCVSVQAAEPDIKSGKTATWTVQIWTQNGPAHDATLTLTASPAGQQPRFVTSCPGGNGDSSCVIGDIGTAITPSSYQLQAQITAPAGASALALTASAGTTPAMAVVPAAGQSVTITGPSSSPTPAPSRSAAAVTTTAPAARQSAQSVLVPTAAGALPALPSVSAATAESNATIPAGSVATVLPQVTPASIASSPAANVQTIPAPSSSIPTAAGSFTFSMGMSGKTAVTLGIILLALTVTLACTRLIATEMARTRQASARHRGSPEAGSGLFTIRWIRHPRQHLAGWAGHRRARAANRSAAPDHPADSAPPGAETEDMR
jgi:hypothetical protein